MHAITQIMIRAMLILAFAGTETNAHEPPREAVQACEGPAEGEACTFKAPDRAIVGTCQIVTPETLACVPHEKPHHRPKTSNDQ